MLEQQTIKDGARHLASLQDGRSILINGTTVREPVTHPAFRNVTRTAAKLYDF